MSALTMLTPKSSAGNGNGRGFSWLSPLNLHWAGVGVLVLANVYFLVRMGLLWHAAGYYSPDAMAQQKVELKAAVIAAQPLRGLDAKLADSTAAADRFSRDRLPASDSAMVGELGDVAKAHGVKLMRVQYSLPVTVLGGTAGELSEQKMDATLSGDYRPLVQFINSLERDKMFFVINGVTLTGQQSGTVNLRLRLTTYLRGGGEVPAGASALNGETASAAVPDGGAQ